MVSISYGPLVRAPDLASSPLWHHHKPLTKQGPMVQIPLKKLNRILLGWSVDLASPASIPYNLPEEAIAKPTY